MRGIRVTPLEMLFMRQAKAQGIKTPFIGSDGWGSENLDLQACEGSYFTEHYWAGDPRAEVKAFIAAYSAKFKDTPVLYGRCPRCRVCL